MRQKYARFTIEGPASVSGSGIEFQMQDAAGECFVHYLGPKAQNVGQLEWIDPPSEYFHSGQKVKAKEPVLMGAVYHLWRDGFIISVNGTFHAYGEDGNYDLSDFTSEDFELVG